MTEMMTDLQIINLATDNGALVKEHPFDNEVTLITFTLDELKEFIDALKEE